MRTTDDPDEATYTMLNVADDPEVTILARVLGNDEDELPADMARYLLTLAFSTRDKARMHDLAVRNQHDGLSPVEKKELTAYARTGTIVSILKSKARRVLKVKPKKSTNG
jgi:hypothetical protein